MSVGALWDTGDLGPIGRRPGILWSVAAASVVGTAALMVVGAPVGPVVMFVLVSAGLVGTLRALVPPAERRPIFRLGAVVYVAHVVAAIALFAASYAAGLGGFYFGDDRAYSYAAGLAADYVRGSGDPRLGPPSWGGYGYLLTLFGWIEAGIFAILGREVISAEILNAGLMTLAVVFVYLLAARLFDRRAALVAAALSAFFPSVFLWSVLNLKDALALFLVMGILALLAHLQAGLRMPMFLGALGLFWLLTDVRLWLYYLLVPCFVVGLAISRRPNARSRAVWALTAIAATALIAQVATTGTMARLFGPAFFMQIGNIRHAMAAPARSGYSGATPLPMQVREGDVLVVTTPSPSLPTTPQPSPSPAPTTATRPSPSLPTTPQPSPSPAPTTIVVPPGAVLVLADGTASPPPGAVAVHAGDRVVVLSSGTPDAGQTARPIVVGPQDGSVTVSTSEQISVSVLSHAPEGLLYALFAPLPWQTPFPAAVAVTVDMILWYGILLGGVISVWRARAHWRLLAPPALYVLGGLGVFALVEGNLGTLLRHRAMLIVPLIALASPTLVSWIAALRRRSPRGLVRIADALATHLS